MSTEQHDADAYGQELARISTRPRRRGSRSSRPWPPPGSNTSRPTTSWFVGEGWAQKRRRRVAA
ncbi:hypothetical protein AB0E78_40025 [Streptomyces sp. NPDC032198]|uniref:hypothetical protein n=1 Tax=Streptomyces sp. NPDC032198 TaxID=3155127 RepID=UPI0033DCD971